MEKEKFQHRILLIVFSVLAVNISFFAGFLYEFGTITLSLGAFNLGEYNYQIVLIVLNLLFLLVSTKRSDFLLGKKRFFGYLLKISLSDVMGVILGYVLLTLSIKNLAFSNKFFFVFGFSLLVQLLFVRVSLVRRFQRRIAKGLGDTSIIIFANYKDIRSILSKYIRNKKSVKYIFCFDPQFDQYKNFTLHQPSQFEELIDANSGIKEAIIVFNNRKKFHKIYDRCEQLGMLTKVIPGFHDLVERQFVLEPDTRIPILVRKPKPLETGLSQLVKRIFDIFFASLVMVTIFPIIYMIVGSIIKLTSKGPVFFKQERTGLNHNNFICWKFRTMRMNTENRQATKNDPRITKIGEFLRKTNLDEFPQFINVIQGNMSVVGPRPHPVFLTEQFADKIRFYRDRHLCKPGITGWAQVNGYRGETKEDILMEKRIEYDRDYIENWSFWLDIKIVFMTVFNMVKGEENAY